MKQNATRYITIAARIAVATFFCTGIFANCARVGGITGGPKDTLPPLVVKMTPEARTLNFTAREVYIEFDEYVQLKDQYKEFFTSPWMKKMPEVKIKKKGVRIIVPDSLLPDQTYVFNFAGSVVDNHEGNPQNGLKYVFSTGGGIDSMVMSGYTVDAMKGDSVSKTFVWFFDAALDSIPAYDSVVFNNRPEAVARAENNGIFIAEHLKPKDYRLYAVQDNNSNGQYDAGVDKIGFMDSVYNPVRMQGFDAWFDTTRLYMTAQPQLYFRMFTDMRPARQNLQMPTRPLQHKVMMTFGAPWPQIDSLAFEGIDTAQMITEYLKPTHDSIALWFDVPQGRMPDTLKGAIVYRRPDSTGVMGPHKQELKLSWKKSESREQQRERERLEKEIERAVAAGAEPPKVDNPFRYTLTQTELAPGRSIEIGFDYPLAAIDSAAVSLTHGDSTARRPVPMRMVRDTMAVRKWRIEARWEAGARYELVIPPRALRNIVGEMNDSISRRFEVPKADAVASVVVEVTGRTPESEYIVELTDEGGQTIETRRHVRTGKVEFTYVRPGNVRLKITEDANGNGEWNTGNLVNRSQPERTELFMDKPGEPSFEVRAGWVETRKIDMGVLFAPITMQSIWEKLEKEEEVRLKKLTEELAKRREQQRKEKEKGTGGNAMDMMRGSGLGLPGM